MERPCTLCGLEGHTYEFRLMDAQKVRVSTQSRTLAVGVVTDREGLSRYACEAHRLECQAAGESFESMADFEARILAADAADRLRG